jgi:protein tyrosine/serine phosphatase
LPSAGKSASSFDLPSRRNVLQIDIPTSQTQRTSYNYNAGTQQAPNQKLQFHGIEPVKPSFHGRFKEVKANVDIPKNKKKVTKENLDNVDLKKVKEDALNTAKKIENTATTLLSQVHASPSQMSVPIHFKNKRQTNNLKLDKKQV